DTGHNKNLPGSRSVRLGCPSCSSCCLHLLRTLLRGSQAQHYKEGLSEDQGTPLYPEPSA
ncbi:Hypothetical predicted protein, partial [Marmota monax]